MSYLDLNTYTLVYFEVASFALVGSTLRLFLQVNLIWMFLHCLNFNRIPQYTFKVSFSLRADQLRVNKVTSARITDRIFVMYEAICGGKWNEREGPKWFGSLSQDKTRVVNVPFHLGDTLLVSHVISLVSFYFSNWRNNLYRKMYQNESLRCQTWCVTSSVHLTSNSLNLYYCKLLITSPYSAVNKCRKVGSIIVKT